MAGARVDVGRGFEESRLMCQRREPRQWGTRDRKQILKLFKRQRMPLVEMLVVN